MNYNRLANNVIMFHCFELKKKKKNNFALSIYLLNLYKCVFMDIYVIRICIVNKLFVFCVYYKQIQKI